MENKRFEKEIIDGLKSNPKFISAKWHYDKKGSDIFEEITKLEEYYLTNSEIEILNNNSKKILEIVPQNIHIVELGAGSEIDKITPFLDNIFEKSDESHYTCIDISEEACNKLVKDLKEKYTDFESKINGVPKEFDHALHDLKNINGAKLVLFFGSSIGNFNEEDEEISFLKTIKSELNPGDYLLIGFDLVKDKATLEKAYNDSKGVTAEFNINVLRRLNTELRSNFSIPDFEFLSYYDSDLKSVESYLISKKTQNVRLNGSSIDFEDGEKIHMEHSRKYDNDHIERISKKLNLEIVHKFFDNKKYFTDVLFRVN